MKLFASALLSFFLVGGWAAAAEPLVWKFAVGDVHNYQMVQEMNMTMDTGPDGSTESAIKQTIDTVWEINSIDDNGVAVVTQTINRVQMDISAPGQAEVHFDTSSDQPPQGFAAMLAPVFKALISSPFKMTMTSRGEITDVEMPETLIEAIGQTPGGAMIGAIATEEGFKNIVRQSSLTLPSPEELVEGHQWTTSLEVDNPIAGKITTETTYEYQGVREVEGQQMEVFAPKIVTHFGDDGATIKVEKQETTGEILFNRSAGHLESSTVHQLMDTVITVGGNTVNQHMDQTISFRMTNDE